MQLENETRRKSEEIFDTYADVDDGFYKTQIPIFAACLDCDPVSRSQARRISSRLESFREVILDFEKADIMGQGFADELFRVYHNEHPDVIMTPINMNSAIQKMYLRVINNKISIPNYR